MRLPCRVSDNRLHGRMARRGKHERRILQIHENQVGAARSESVDAVSDLSPKPLCSATPGYVVCAKLPDNEIGIVMKDIGLETQQIARNGVADAATVDNLDLRLRSQAHQLTPHHLGIGRGGV